MKYKKYTDDDLKVAVATETSYRGVLRKLGLSIDCGWNYNHIKTQICNLKLCVDHFKGQGYLKGNTHNFTKEKYTLDELLVEHSNHCRHNIKRRIIKAGLIENKCSICGLEKYWMDKPIVLILDHINGTNDDYRIKNLRLVCPNCNSQLSTFTSRNIINKRNNG